jgi:hypothetical protein
LSSTHAEGALFLGLIHRMPLRFGSPSPYDSSQDRAMLVCMDLHAQDSETRYGFGLTEAEVRRLQDILRSEGESEVTLDHAWARAIELLTLFRLLLGPLPEDHVTNND